MAHSAILKFIKKWKPNEVVHMGDALDNSGISKHSEHQYIEQVNSPIVACFIGFGKLVDAVYDASPQSRQYWIWGNHDDRLLKFVQKNPSLAGILDNPLELLGKQGKCRHADCVTMVQLEDPEDSFNLGKMAFNHGHYTGKHAACQHVEAYGESVTVGHTHTMQMFTTLRRGVPASGWTIGHTSTKPARKYLRGAPHRWVTGFAFIEYDGVTGEYTQHPLPIVNGSFRFAGEVYSGDMGLASDKR